MITLNNTNYNYFFQKNVIKKCFFDKFSLNLPFLSRKNSELVNLLAELCDK